MILDSDSNDISPLLDVAEEARGAINGWDFKHYVLGALFYRFINE